MRRRALALLFVLGGCNWVHQHSAATAAAVTGAVIGFTGCEIGAGKNTTCLAVGGGAALFLGGLAWLATTFLDTNDQTQAPSPTAPELTRGGAIRVHTRTLPPPVPVDAGVVAPDAAVVVPTSTEPSDAAVDAPPDAS